MRAADTLRSAAALVRGRLYLRGARLGARVRSFGPMIVDGAEGITVGDRVAFLGGMLPTALECRDGGRIVIGPETLFNYGVTISARASVELGARCRVGSFVHVRDDDGRSASPVRIEDDVWLAHGAIVDAGSVIGAGSVVAAGAVVRGDVPARSLATGNPAVFAPLDDDRVEPGRPLQLAADCTPADVRMAIIDWLDETRCFGEAAQRIRSDSESLRDAGVLDSLGLVQLVLMLESRFGVRLDRGVVTHRDRQSLDALVSMVTGA